MSDEDNERTKQAVEEYWRRVETVEPMVTFAMHEIVRIETIPTGEALIDFVFAKFAGTGAEARGVCVRVWLATGHTDMRKGFASLSLQVQEVLRRDPLSGQLFCFRGRRGDLLKVIWHDGQGACLFTKRLERGRYLWPSATDGAVTISSAQLGYLLSGIDWRNPQATWRPTSVG